MNIAYKTIEQDSCIEIDAGLFRAALAKARLAIERRNTIPILDCVHIRAEHGNLHLTGTNLDMIVQAEAPLDMIGWLDTCVNAKALDDLVKGAKGSVTFRMDGDKLAVKCGAMAATLATMPVSDFPVSVNSGKSDPGGPQFDFRIDAAVLAERLGRVSFAMLADEYRYYLNGIRLQAVDGGARLTTTDGHRMAEAPLPISNPGKGEIIIPRMAVSALEKALKKTTGGIAVTFSGNDGPGIIRFDAEEWSLQTKLVDGTFPNSDRIKPGEALCRLAVDRKAMIAAMASFPKSYGRVSFDVENGVLTLGASVPDIGNASVTIPATCNRAICAAFNPRYIRDFLNVMTGDVVEFDFIDPHSPVVIRDSADAPVYYLLMPMR